jgi:hypothetical protein
MGENPHSSSPFDSGKNIPQGRGGFRSGIIYPYQEIAIFLFQLVGSVSNSSKLLISLISQPENDKGKKDKTQEEFSLLG